MAEQSIYAQAAAVKSGLKLAEVVCGAYPTPEGCEAERRKNTRVVQAAYRALDELLSKAKERKR